jgi:hypothetical protein
VLLVVQHLVLLLKKPQPVQVQKKLLDPLIKIKALQALNPLIPLVLVALALTIYFQHKSKGLQVVAMLALL